jgi:CRISPR-associated protein Cas4
MVEMGYDVETLAFYEISTNNMISVSLPTEEELAQFRLFIQSYKYYDPSSPLRVNHNKCTHCIYCSLCDKTDENNVYQ